MLRILLITALLPAQSALADQLPTPKPVLTKPSIVAMPSATVAEHYWYDGDQRRELLVDARLGIDFVAGKAILIEKPARADKALDAATTADAPVDSPVFRDADSPAVKRALPGGAILTTRDPTDAAALDRRLAAHGLSVSRQLDAGGTRWLIETPSGIAGLELANRLHESGDFAAVTPNWWRERALK